jgi:zinc transporter 1/2/3
MIAIQATMNPIGVGIGWALSDQGPLVTGIFTSISAGTFLYIATLEVIV